MANARPLFSGILLLSLLSGCASKDWVGQNSEDWSDPDNWDPSGVPTSTEIAQIGTETSDEDVNVFSLETAGGANVTNGMHLTIGNPLAPAGLTLSNSAQVNSSEGSRPSGIVLLPNAELSVGGDSAAISGVELSNGSFIDLAPQSQLTAGASIVIDSASEIRGWGSITLDDSDAPLLVDGKLVAVEGGYLQIDSTAGATLDLDGAAEGGVLDASAPGSHLMLSGTLADAFSGSALLGPGSELYFGAAPGNVTLNGTLSVASGSTTSYLIASPDVHLAGATDIDGTLQVVAETTLTSGAVINLPDSEDDLILTKNFLYDGGSVSGLGAVHHDRSITVTGHSTVDVGLFDLDGGSAEYRELIVNPGASLSITASAVDQPGDFSEGYDGLVRVEAGGNLTVTTPGPWQISSALQLIGTAGNPASITGAPLIVQGPFVVPPSVTVQINAILPDITVPGDLEIEGPPGQNTLVAGEVNLPAGSRLVLSPGSDASITADDFVLAGETRLNDNALQITTPTPWRLEGYLKAASFVGNVISGSPFVVGSPAGTARIDASEPLIIESDVTLESSTTVDVWANSASGSLSFEGFTVLDGVTINESTGPFDNTGMAANQPSATYLKGDVSVTDSSVIYANYFSLGGFSPTTAHTLTVQANRSFLANACTIQNSSLFSIVVESGGTFEINKSCGSGNWTNEMTVTLTDATFRSTPFVHEGAILGTGTLDATIVGGSGTVAPGFSPGAIRVLGDVHLQGGRFEMELGGSEPADYDRFEVQGAFSLRRGVLALELIDGFEPGPGDEFLLFPAGQGRRSLEFSEIALPELKAGLTWDLNRLELTGMIRVTRAEQPGITPS